MFGSFVGIAAAFFFVMGLLFLTFRLLRGLPALAGTSKEGPELRVLSRASLTQKQGIATVRVGDRTLVVGYGDGGVRALGEVEASEVGAAGTRVAAATAPSKLFSTASSEAGPSVDDATADEVPPLAARVPFRDALAKAVRQVNLFGIALLAAALVGAAMAEPAAASTVATQAAEAAQVVDLPSIDLAIGNGNGEDLRLEGPVGTVLFVGFLTLIPTLLLLMTSFTRILVTLHLLKQALGTQTAPPAHLISAMALLLTGFVMQPALQTANTTAVRPWLDGEIDEMQMMKEGVKPFREFMLASVRESDLAAFMEMSNTPVANTVDDIPLVVLSSAFVTSELRAAFQMGFALFLPFVVIDVVVASVLMSMGMFMLPPVMVSLPFKLLLFVLVDGWALVMGSIVRSFATV